jgi:CheY-like chemotaxis protein
MDKYRIVYIDEEEKDRENFSELLSSELLDVVSIHPNVIEADLIKYIIDEKFDALIIDHRLYGKDATIKYSGAEIVQQMQDMREKFPAFVLTRNRDEDEVGDKIEEILIFTKDELMKTPSEIQRRIAGTIKHYKKVNNELENRLAELLKKREEQKKLDDADTQELLNINYEIERRMNKHEILPDLLKESGSLKALNKVIKDAQAYLNKVKK